METQFLTPIDKAEIVCKDNVEAFNILLNEIDRLESIIKNYENAIQQLNQKYSSSIFKKPEIK